MGDAFNSNIPSIWLEESTWKTFVRHLKYEDVMFDVVSVEGMKFSHI